MSGALGLAWPLCDGYAQATAKQPLQRIPSTMGRLASAVAWCGVKAGPDRKAFRGLTRQERCDAGRLRRHARVVDREHHRAAAWRGVGE